MLDPLLPATALLKVVLPAGASLLSQVGSLFGGLLNSSSGEEPDPVDGLRADEGLLTQILLNDPVLRETLKKEVDRRLSDDIPEDAETTRRLEQLRDLLRRLEGEAAPSAPRDFPMSARALPDAAAVAVEIPLESQPLAAIAVPPPPLVMALPVPARVPVAPAPGVSAAVVEAVVPSIPSSPAVSTALRGPVAMSGAASADLVDRVLRAARLTQSRGVARLRLVLTPPDLGELHLDLSVRGKVLHATIEADRPSAAEALLAQWPSLRAALEAQGFEIGGFSVTSDGGFARDGEGGGPTADVAAPTAVEVAEEQPAGPAPSRGAQILDLKA